MNVENVQLIFLNKIREEAANYALKRSIEILDLTRFSAFLNKIFFLFFSSSIFGKSGFKLIKLEISLMFSDSLSLLNIESFLIDNSDSLE